MELFYYCFFLKYIINQTKTENYYGKNIKYKWQT